MFNLIVGSESPKVNLEPVSTLKNSTSGQSSCHWPGQTINLHDSILELREIKVLSIPWSEKGNEEDLEGRVDDHSQEPMVG